MKLFIFQEIKPKLDLLENVSNVEENTSGHIKYRKQVRIWGYKQLLIWRQIVVLCCSYVYVYECSDGGGSVVREGYQTDKSAQFKF